MSKPDLPVGLDAALITRHMANMRRLGVLKLRQQYLAEVERTEGEGMAKALREAFAADWERRKVSEA